jgi:hypothetical protein
MERDSVHCVMGQRPNGLSAYKRLHCANLFASATVRPSMTDDGALGTKADIKRAIERIDRCIQNLRKTAERSKDEVLDNTDGWKDELHLPFDATVETIRRDLRERKCKENRVLRDTKWDRKDPTTRLDQRVGVGD